MTDRDVKVGDLCKESGVTRQTLYRFVGPKGELTKAAPNNYRSDRFSGDPSVIARSPCDEAIQGPQHARRQQPRRSYCGPWIASLRSQ
jgi:hypothetical protein